MEVRCGSCNKLFRVSDDKITGTGIKFACSRCGEYVKIAKQDFEQYNLTKAAAPAPAAAPVLDAVGLGKAAVEQRPVKPETPPVFVKPTPPLEQAPKPAPVAPKVEIKKEPLVGAKKEPKPAAAMPQAAAAKPAPSPKPVPNHAPVPPAPQQPAAGPSALAHEPAQLSTAAPISLETAAPSGGGKKILVIIAVLLVLGGGLAYGVKVYLGKSAQRASDAVKQLTSPDGLQVANAAGAVDPVNGDLVISGLIENTTDKPKPAWYVVAEVYDAQGGVLIKAKLLSGKQLYTKRDYDILAKRGVNIQELKTKQVQEQGVIIPAKGSTNFTISIMEPPVGVASFNATLQPFDPVQLFKEIAEEQ